MPRYADLEKVMKEAKRNEANWSEDFRKVYNSIESHSAVVHNKDNRRSTTEEQRSDYYRDTIAYIQLYAGSNYNLDKIRTGDQLTEINRLSKSISQQMTVFAGAGQVFQNTANDLDNVIRADSEAVENNASVNDIMDYTTNVHNVINNARQLTREKKLDRATLDMLNQLGTNMDLVIGNERGIDLQTRRALTRSVSKIASFYNDNLFDASKRSELKNDDKIVEFNKDVTRLMTENLTAVNALKVSAPDHYQNLETVVNRTNSIIKSDMDTINQNVATSKWIEWESRKLEMEQEVRQAHEQQVQQQMEQHGFVTKEQQDLQNVINANPEQYAEITFIDSIKEVLGIDETKFPEKISYEMPNREDPNGPPRKIERDLRKEIIALKTAAMAITSTTAAYYSKDQSVDGKTHFMNYDEIKKAADAFSEFSSCQRRVESSLRRSGNLTPELEKTLQNVHTSTLHTSSKLYEAERYLDEYAVNDQIKQEKLFSIYEMQGKVNPDADGSFLVHVKNTLAAGQKLVETYNNKDTAKKKKNELKYAAEEIEDISKTIKTLTENVLPDAYKGNSVGDHVLNPVTADQIKTLNDSYNKAYLALNHFTRDYEIKFAKKDLAGMTEEEQNFYANAKEVKKRCEQKMLLTAYLLGEDNELAKDIKNYNDAVEKNKTLPADQKIKLPDAGIYKYAMACKEHMDKNTLLPQFLLDDPESPRLSSILSMMNTKKNIDETNRFENELNDIKWNNGKRSLDKMADYDLMKKQIGSSSNIYQFVTNGDREEFVHVFEQCMKTMPKELKELEIKGKKVDVEKKLRDYYDLFVYEVNLDGELILKDGEKIPNNGTRSFSTGNDGTEYGGFSRAFDDEELEDPELSKFLKMLNRNMYNAGFGEGANFNDLNVGLGYNEGIARESAYNLNPGMYPKTTMFEKTNLPFYGGKANPDMVSNVYIGKVDPNTDTTSKPMVFPNVYNIFSVTPTEFRKADFVSDIATYAVKKADAEEFKGLSKQEIQHKLDAKVNEARKNEQKGIAKRQPITNCMRDYSSFDNGKVLKDVADLQVMDYLLNLPTRKPEEMRMNLAIKSPQNEGRQIPEIVGISGANTEALPFVVMSDKEAKKKLTDPENMLVMSATMAHNVRRWAKGDLYDEEKKMFDKMPKIALQGFIQKAKNINEILFKSQTHEFNDEMKATGDKRCEGGLDIQQGYIRVLTDAEFKELSMDELALGRQGKSITEKENAPIVNLFDTLAKMPNFCHEALIDKQVARMMGADETSLKMGEGIYDEKWAKDLRSETLDRKFNRYEAERVVNATIRLQKLIYKMENDPTDEPMLHILRGNSTQYQELVTSFNNLLTVSAFSMRDAYRENEYLANPAAYKNQYPDRAAEIERNRQERLEFAKKLAREKGLPEPTKLPPIEEDPNLFHKVMEKYAEVSGKVEAYFEKNKKPGTDFGKARQRYMATIYNEVNKKMNELAYYTGNTMYPPKTVTIKPDFTVEYKNTYNSRLEYEMKVSKVTNKEFQEKNRNNLSSINDATRLRKLKSDLKMDRENNKIQLAQAEANKNHTEPDVNKVKTDLFDDLVVITENDVKEIKSQYGNANTKEGRSVRPTFVQKNNVVRPSLQNNNKAAAGKGGKKK